MLVKFIDSASDDVEHYLDRTDFDEARFEELDQRIISISNWRANITSNRMSFMQKCRKSPKKAVEMEGLSDLTALFNKAHEAKTQYDKLAGELSKERKKRRVEDAEEHHRRHADSGDGRRFF